MASVSRTRHRPALRAACRLFFPGLLVAALLAAPPAWGADPAQPARELIAVLDLQAVGATEVEAAALTERLRETLLKTRRFTLVDRSQLTAVLNEQALQQTGCTSQDCAVQVGRILGVRKIVSGRVLRLGERQWVLSALLVDVETAETLRVESVRYRGELFDLLDEQMPGLAQRLAGLETAPNAAAGGAEVTSLRAVPPAPAAPAAPAARGATAAPAAERIKVAIFPSRLDGLLANDLRKEEPARVGRIVKILQDTLKPMRLELSAVPAKNAKEAHERFLKLPVAAEVQQLAWSGIFIKDPDAEFIYRTGRALGVDLVVLYKARKDRGSDRTFGVYVFDVNRLKLTQRDGYWPDGKLTAALVPALVEALAPFRRPAQQRPAQ